MCCCIINYDKAEWFKKQSFYLFTILGIDKGSVGQFSWFCWQCTCHCSQMKLRLGFSRQSIHLLVWSLEWYQVSVGMLAWLGLYANFSSSRTSCSSPPSTCSLQKDNHIHMVAQAPLKCKSRSCQVFLRLQPGTVPASVTPYSYAPSCSATHRPRLRPRRED